MKNPLCSIFAAAALSLIVGPACSKSKQYLDRRPAPAEIAGEWHSRDIIPGANGKEMIITLRADKTCDVVDLPLYDNATRAYKIVSGSGQWIFNPSFHVKGGARIIVAPDSFKSTAATEVMMENGQIVLQYSTDPESSDMAYFRRK